jgi:hypothetical protein
VLGREGEARRRGGSPSGGTSSEAATKLQPTAEGSAEAGHDGDFSPAAAGHIGAPGNPDLNTSHHRLRLTINHTT